MVKAFDLVREEASTVDQDHCKLGHAVQGTSENEAAGCECRLKRVAHEVVQVIFFKASHILKHIGVQDHWDTEIHCLAPERVKRGVSERTALYVGVDHCPVESERKDSVAKLSGGRERVLERYRCQPVHTKIRRLQAFSEPLVQHPAPRLTLAGGGGDSRRRPSAGR